MSKYDDIINMPHHVSAKRTPMSLENRAAQFAPFAALSGHDDAIAETARIVSQKPELSDDDLNSLSRRLAYSMENNVEIRITYFQPDNRKHGGLYKEICAKVKGIDDTEGTIIFTDRSSIPLCSVVRIECDVFDGIAL